MSEIRLDLSVDEANLVLEALGQMPFARVFTLVGKIQSQASRQLDKEQGQTGPSLIHPREEGAADGS